MPELTLHQYIAAALILAAIALFTAWWRYRRRIPIDFEHCRFERDYQRVLRDNLGGRTEVSVKAGRVDWVVDIDNKTHAIEIDWAGKWECIGQALYYGMELKNHPGVVLIARNAAECEKAAMIKRVIDYYQLPITFWTVPE